LESLKHTQKAFFEFLEKEDAGLLQFDDEELEDKEEPEEEPEEAPEDKMLTKEIFDVWKKEAYTNVRAFFLLWP
jgi:hypothetical protein